MNTAHSKNVDFDRVADLYDKYVRIDYDIDFWKTEAEAADGTVLELMCGTGRIGKALVDAGISYAGLDYCERQIDQFKQKLPVSGAARLIFADARQFQLPQTYKLIFIGYSSLSEVLDNNDKLQVLQRIRSHLQREGHFTFSLRNPSVLKRKHIHTEEFELHDGFTLAYEAQFEPPDMNNIVRGSDSLVIKNTSGKIVDERRLELRFHMISRAEVEALLHQAGFVVEVIWGDYDRSPFASDSRFMIFRCKAARSSP